ncbi:MULTISPECIES: hypothetical protein [unclassified Levilactobacillus]|uniref:hypothetical protein n=1 Tax=unclassified Levilactobacillus TaxID=2767918 RepID=UPI002FF23045
MIHPHDKVSWHEGDHRYWGFVQAIINRQAYVTAMIEHQGVHIELPLEQLILERTR